MVTFEPERSSCEVQYIRFRRDLSGNLLGNSPTLPDDAKDRAMRLTVATRAAGDLTGPLTFYAAEGDDRRELLREALASMPSGSRISWVTWEPIDPANAAA
jgi:hypothetical protein